MNCREFDRHVMDWARGVALAREARTGTEAHAAGCVRCQARLAGEQQLSLALRRIAAAAAPGEAPGRVERTLREEFRSHIGTPVSPELPKNLLRPVHGGWAWAVAAAVLITGIFFWLQQSRRQDSPTPAPSLVLETPLAQPPMDTAPGPATPVAPPIPATAENRTPSAPAGEQAGSEPSPPSVPQAVAAAPREIRTDFLPLIHGEQLVSGDRVQLVRVRLPGEALAHFGLPVGADPVAPIPADILLGEDGTARAVRFIRLTAGAEQ